MYDTCATVADVGVDVGLSDVAAGRIITLVQTPSTSYRLRAPYKQTLEHLAQQRHQSPKEIIELAIAHLAGTLRNGQPVYMDLPPDEPKGHKKVRSVA